MSTSSTFDMFFVASLALLPASQAGGRGIDPQQKFHTFHPQLRCCWLVGLSRPSFCTSMVTAVSISSNVPVGVRVPSAQCLAVPAYAQQWQGELQNVHFAQENSSTSSIHRQVDRGLPYCLHRWCKSELYWNPLQILLSELFEPVFFARIWSPLARLERTKVLLIVSTFRFLHGSWTHRDTWPHTVRMEDVASLLAWTGLDCHQRDA